MTFDLERASPYRMVYSKEDQEIERLRKIIKELEKLKLIEELKAKIEELGGKVD